MEGYIDRVFAQFNLGEHVMVSSRHVKKLYHKICAQAVQEEGLSQNEIDVILFLHKYALVDTAKEIAKYRCMSKSLVCKSVDALTGRGYLEVVQDRDDRRYQHLKLSQRGRQVVQKLQEAREAFLADIQQGIDQEELEVFLRVLSKIRNNARKEVERYGKSRVGNGDRESRETV